MKKHKKSKAAKNQTKISAAEFERKFDAGEDITPWLDLKNARRLYPSAVHIPPRILKSIDREAVRRGVTRQTLVNTLLSKGLENSLF